MEKKNSKTLMNLALLRTDNNLKKESNTIVKNRCITVAKTDGIYNQLEILRLNTTNITRIYTRDQKTYQRKDG